MAGEKNQAVVAVIGGLTKRQAANIVRDIMNSKTTNAPHGRGTVTTGEARDVGKMLGGGQGKLKEIETKKEGMSNEQA